jgi:glycosyltransferase involved in cell wall biosynthesis
VQKVLSSKYHKKAFSLKSIHVVASIADESSGPSYTVSRLCTELRERELDVVLATLEPAPDNPPAYLKTFKCNIGPARLGYSSTMKEWLFRIKPKDNIQTVLHYHGLWMMPCVYAPNAAYHRGYPSICSPRGTLSPWAMRSGSRMKYPYYHFLQKPALRKTTAFHATAMSEVEDIRKLGYRQPIAMIPNGIDIPSYFYKKISKEKTLLYLGRIHPKKGIDNLLRAWSTVGRERPDWHLRIVGGDGNAPNSGSGYSQFLKQLVEKEAIPRVVFDGPLHGDAKQRAYNESNLYILPTHSENFGVSVAEALAAGTPAIVTEGAPWGDLDGKNAGRWITNSTESIAKTLLEIMALPHETLVEMGLAGRRWMETEFAWGGIAEKMSHFYSWLLNDSTGRPDFVVVE